MESFNYLPVASAHSAPVGLWQTDLFDSPALSASLKATGHSGFSVQIPFQDLEISWELK